MAGLLDFTAGNGENLSQFLNDPSNSLGLGLLAAGGPTTDPNKSGFGARIQDAVRSSQAAQQQAAALAIARQKAAIMALGTQALAGSLGAPGAVPAGAGGPPPQGPGGPVPAGLLAPGAGAPPGGGGAPPPPMGGPGAATAAAGAPPPISPAPTIPPAGPTPSSAPGLFGMSAGQANNVAAALNLANDRDITGNVAASQPHYVDVGGGNFVDTNPATNPNWHGGQQRVITPSARTGVATGVDEHGNAFLPPGALDVGALVQNVVNRSKAENELSRQPIQTPNGIVYPSVAGAIDAARGQLGTAAPPAALASSGPPLIGRLPGVVPGGNAPIPGLAPLDVPPNSTYTGPVVDGLDRNTPQGPPPLPPRLLPGLTPVSTGAPTAAAAGALLPGIGAPPTSVQALQAQQAAVAAQSNGTSGPTFAQKQQIEAAAAAQTKLQEAQAEGTITPQQQAMADSYKALTTNAANAPKVIQLTKQLQALSDAKGTLTSMGPLGDSEAARMVNPAAAEYYKQASTLASLIAPGGAGTDASRSTLAATIPPYGYPKDAQKNGLAQITQLAQQDQLRSQVLAPKFTAGTPTTAADYVSAEAQFNQHITPAAASVISQINAMPKGLAKQAAAKAFYQSNPKAGEWAAANGALQ